MKALIVKLSSIGDVVQTLPALYSLRKSLGKKAELDWLVEEPSSSILKGNPLIDNLFVVKNRGWTKDLSANLKTARLLASRKYDMVLDFQGLLKSGVWVRAAKGARSIGFSNARELSSIFLTEKLPPYDPDTHAVDRYLKLAAYAGGAQGKAVFQLNITKEDREKVLGILTQRGMDAAAKARFFVIAPQARWETKLWDDHSFARLAKTAIERFGVYAVLAGSEKDKKRYEAICREAGPKAISLAGLIDLKGLAALMGLCLFAITVDTGPMHIAAAAGAKVIALFGPTAPWRTGPYGKGHIIIRTGIPCSPCFKKKCPDPLCMSGIKVEDALNAIERSLNPGRLGKDTIGHDIGV